MDVLAQSSRVYTDMQGFAALRRGAKDNSPEAIRAVAQQFEALFVHSMLKGMRDGALADDLLGGEGVDTYQDLYDQQLALHLTQQRSIGLADLLVRQLSHAEKAPPAPNGAYHGYSLDLKPMSPINAKSLDFQA